jgi:dTDP-4-dehydrorhamnose reductase
MANLNRNSKVLVVGGQSTLGKKFVSALTFSGYDVDYTGRRPSSDYNFIKFDLRDSTENFLHKKYEYAYNFSGITGEAECIANNESSYINVIKTLDLLEYLSGYANQVYQISTSEVFSGIERNQHVNSPLKPNGLYAHQKALVENESNRLNFKIIRFGKILNPEVSIFQHWMKLLNQGIEITAFTNVYLSPLNTEHLTDLLLSTMKFKDIKIFQFSSVGDLSYFEMALMLCKTLDLDSSLVRPSLCQDYAVAKYSSLEANPSALIPLLPTAADVAREFINEICLNNTHNS